MKKIFAVMIAILIILLLIDLYAYKAMMHLLHHSTPFTRNLSRWMYWGISLFFLALIVSVFLSSTGQRDPKTTSRIFLLAGIMLALYIPKLFFAIFHLTEDIGKLAAMGIHKLSALVRGTETHPDPSTEKISRFKFLTQAGLILAAIPFLSIIWGMVRGRFRFRISHQKLAFPHLPEPFHGLKIVQISDIHIGSFYGYKKKVKEAVEMINALEADLIVFTGDMVNDLAEELNGWEEIFSSLHAPLGKVSILGNHDYGDYFRWDSEEAKRRNLQDLIRRQEAMGFRMLLNESVKIEKNGSYLALIGVENWGKPPFAQYGDFRKAHENVKDAPLKILLSHDPTHWDAEIMGKTNVDLTLSGHTHGMQFGIEIGNVKWSPAQWKYPHWAGLYRENGQYLYVNRGFGYIGYPGRVGIPPEITIIELIRG